VQQVHVVSAVPVVQSSGRRSSGSETAPVVGRDTWVTMDDKTAMSEASAQIAEAAAPMAEAAAPMAEAAEQAAPMAVCTTVATTVARTLALLAAHVPSAGIEYGQKTKRHINILMTDILYNK